MMVFNVDGSKENSDWLHFGRERRKVSPVSTDVALIVEGEEKVFLAFISGELSSARLRLRIEKIDDNYFILFGKLDLLSKLKKRMPASLNARFLKG